jgi:hypothetical protein
MISEFSPFALYELTVLPKSIFTLKSVKCAETSLRNARRGQKSIFILGETQALKVRL